MAISNMDGLVAAMTASTAQNIPWNKTGTSTEGAGTFLDMSQVAGIPSAIATAAAASVGGTSYSGSSAGGLPFVAPSGSNTLYLSSYNATSSVPGSIYLTDRLWACSGLSTTLGATTNVTGMSNITRYNSGVGAEIWHQTISAPGAGTGSGIMTISYTNSAGVSGRTATITLGAGSPPPSAGQCYPATLQAGDTGVRSIESATNTSLTFTGGSHGLFVARRLLTTPITINSPGATVDGLGTGLQQIDPNACINFILLCSQTLSGYWAGNVLLIEG